MKKFLICLLLLTMQCPVLAKTALEYQFKETDKNTEYNTVNIYKRNYQKVNLKSAAFNKSKNIYDPGEIVLSTYKEVKQADFDEKLKKDNAIYDKISNQFYKKSKSGTSGSYSDKVGVDYYKVYRICERLIRANNLDYGTWRVAIRKTPDFNAATYDGNYIIVNTGLYDVLSENDDALAYVLAHEMAHAIFGHLKRSKELAFDFNQYKTYTNRLTGSSKSYAILVLERKYRKLCAESRRMELMADTESLTLLTKAGFSPEKAMEALNFMDTLGGVQTIYSDHPLTAERIATFKENVLVSDPNWVNIGRENIYNSEVLKVKKSSDRVSVIISKSTKNKPFYEVEPREHRILRIAYMKYLQGNMEDAVKYFKMLADVKESYIPYLYMSYANDYLAAQKPRLHKRAVKDAIKAYKLNPSNKAVAERVKELNIPQEKL